MTITAKLYGQSLSSMMNKEIGWTTASIKCALAGSSYTPNQDTHNYFDDITNEVSGSSYTASGLTLAASVYYTASTNTLTLDAEDAIWTSSSIDNARYAILYSTTAACSGSISPLIAYVDFGENLSSQGGSFTITWASTGIIGMVAAS